MMKHIKQLINELQSKKVTYAAVKFSPLTVERLVRFIREGGISNPVDSNELHCTLLYSRKYLSDYKGYGYYESPIYAIPLNLEVWEIEDNKRVLVLPLKCDKLIERHNHLMSKHNATYDFEEYAPHVTLSYDFKGSVDDINASVHEYINILSIIYEYSETLEPNS